MTESTPKPPAVPAAPDPATLSTPVTVVPAGWYPDPELPGGQRWWDGAAWSEHRQLPASTAVQPYAAVATPGEPPLWAPWYGISFGNAIRRAFKKYAAFDGRASLSEYWWFALFTGLIGLGGYFVFLFTIAIAFATGGVGVALTVIVGIAYVGFAIAIIIPSIAIAVRRLHDAGYSGLLYLLALVPFGSIVVLVFTLLPSSPAGTQYDRPV